ncbi:hypothetical protein [Actinoplanes regularis]|uniref:Uncharacterized protein n=1 Tax=Actinoplanes regularis TaxID=52697 RepID=A0A239IWI4_9ACTN|nr:hypothetical protein [Actinoplanes regularis]GIE91605.1 hypothetical protein Are01nite_80850 [Actinoplanes regularis]SNS97929.1 hypothetical protein SAMN06264365_13145 [Actinoplanes regularis]
MNLATLMACATCSHALTEHRHGSRLGFRHPVADEEHEVVPVDAVHAPQVFNRCHTCSGELPVWNYRTGLIQVMALDVGAVATYNDHWHVCYACAQHIEADDVGALTDRCASFMRWRRGSTEYVQLNLLHRGIVLGREGRTLLTTTRWPAARIAAEMLPKVRDRFTGLLGSPVDLPTAINDREGRQSLANQLDLAPMYWINEEFTELVNAVSRNQPPARLSEELMPSSAGLIAWPGAVGPGQLAAVSWTPQFDGWQLLGYRSIGSALREDLMPALRHEIGWLLPAHAEHVPRRGALDGSHPLGPLVTTWLLINQQMAEAVPAKLPKGTTKAYQRSNRPAPDVRIVRIKPRNSAPGPRSPQPDGTRSRAKPDHRYWVSGHERQQAWGPGRTLRKPIDIQPFLKGDESLPIKLSTTVRVLGNRTAVRDS